jgi:DNA (cytosine-5)-methyltransferase 1
MLVTSEWDRFSQKTYRANYGCNHDVAGDIAEIEARDIPKHDVLLAGFPCQPSSSLAW